ncbi:MAG: pantoate--beta-alanine ligase [Thermoleophilia bacterium]|nr:pantoate--beta-alanine ligase [Thermoleophilia bacterium]
MNTSTDPTTRAPIIRTVADLRGAVAALRAEGRTIGFVPTMGALHDGHLSLVRRAAEGGAAVVVSIFVNPTQFAANEDLSKYPRDERGDVEKLTAAGAELVFCPTPDQIYPDGFSTTVMVDGPSQGLEGQIRPTHFAGVATVVAKLLLMVRPDRVVFGQKDAQQVAVVRRLMRDLHMDEIEMVVAPTVREADGLAMSSRNAYLSPDERTRSLALWRGLEAARAAAAGGERDADTLQRVAHAELAAQQGITVDYVRLVDADTFQPMKTLDRDGVLCVAARVGHTRLIDNAPLSPGASH